MDDDPEVRTGTISGDCPAGDYTVHARISGGAVSFYDSADFYVTRTIPQSLSTGATLSALSVQPRNIFNLRVPTTLGEFAVGQASAVTSATVYTVANDANATVNVTETKNSNTVTDNGGDTYSVTLSEGWNRVEVEVTAQDTTTETHKVHIGRGSAGPWKWRAGRDLDTLNNRGINDPWSLAVCRWPLNQQGALVLESASNVVHELWFPDGTDSAVLNVPALSGNDKPVGAWCSDGTEGKLWVADSDDDKVYVRTY